MGSGAKMLKRFDGLRGLKKKILLKKRALRWRLKALFYAVHFTKSLQKSNTQGGSTRGKSSFQGLSCYETSGIFNCYGLIAINYMRVASIIYAAGHSFIHFQGTADIHFRRRGTGNFNNSIQNVEAIRS